jgi:hypothetical protein
MASTKHENKKKKSASEAASRMAASKRNKLTAPDWKRIRRVARKFAVDVPEKWWRRRGSPDKTSQPKSGDRKKGHSRKKGSKN